ncbi:hypothetical protein AGOR_G00101170 [Albula goreensis]|uniref:ZP domain-containing protein n=1 Tax=Albula goreensis TaxID=1534307 RepID=A0A8T3DGL3_9TELE|nr:hypothetical protein AGOR_G00101170 [Albula goreensis]
MLPPLSVGEETPDPNKAMQNASQLYLSLFGPPERLQQGPSSSEPGGQQESGEVELEVWCHGGQLTLALGRRLKDGTELNPESITLGDGCKSNGLSVDHLWFTYSVSQCGTKRSVHGGMQVYRNILQYIPDPSTLAPPLAGAFAAPVRCSVERLKEDDASPAVMSLPVSMKSHGFALTTMDSSWTGAAESSLYRRGEPVRIQATAGSVGWGQRLYVQSCHATASPEPESRPRVRLIVKKGCVAYVVSKRGQARFIPSGARNAVNFLFNAFRFRSPEIYLHCELVVREDKVSSGSKFCNYNQRKQRWEELNGDVTVCSCCKTECDESAQKDSPAGPSVWVSTGPLIVMETDTPVPGLRGLPVTMETTPLPPAVGTPLGYPEAQRWLWPPPAEGATDLHAQSFLDGSVVMQEGFGGPQGWPAAGVGSQGPWALPPAVVEGGVMIIRHVPEEQSHASSEGVYLFVPPQNDADLLQYLRDDPSAADPWNPVRNGPFPQPWAEPDPIQEEARRKRWWRQEWGEGQNSELSPNAGPAQQQHEPVNGEAELNPLDGVAVSDEGMVVQRTEVVMQKGRGRRDPIVLSRSRSRLTLTRSEGPAQMVRYEEEERGVGEGNRATKRKIVLEEENVQPMALKAVLRRMYKAE